MNETVILPTSHSPQPMEPEVGVIAPVIVVDPPEQKTGTTTTACTSKMIRIRSLSPVFRMVIELCVPEKNEICPIMMEPIEEYELPFAPRKCVGYRQYKLKKIRLPCNHEMSAVACIFHFARIGMHCPLCRRGTQQKLDLTCLHTAISKDIRSHIQKMDEEERAEREAEDRRVGVALLMADILQNIQSSNRNNRIVLAVYCYSLTNALVPVITLEFDLMNQIHNNTLEFVLSLHDTRMMSMNMQNVPFLSDMEFALGIRTSTREFVFLDRCSKFSVDSIKDDENIRFGRSMGKFHIFFKKTVTLSVLSLKWATNLQDFSGILSRNVHAVRVS